MFRSVHSVVASLTLHFHKTKKTRTLQFLPYHSRTTNPTSAIQNKKESHEILKTEPPIFCLIIHDQTTKVCRPNIEYTITAAAKKGPDHFEQNPKMIIFEGKWSLHDFYVPPCIRAGVFLSENWISASFIDSHYSFLNSMNKREKEVNNEKKTHAFQGLITCSEPDFCSLCFWGRLLSLFVIIICGG